MIINAKRRHKVLPAYIWDVNLNGKPPHARRVILWRGRTLWVGKWGRYPHWPEG